MLSFLASLKAGLWLSELADSLVLLQIYILYIFTQHLVWKACKGRTNSSASFFIVPGSSSLAPYLCPEISKWEILYLHLPYFMCGGCWWWGVASVGEDGLTLPFQQFISFFFSSLVLPILQTKTLPVRKPFSTWELGIFLSLK